MLVNFSVDNVKINYCRYVVTEGQMHVVILLALELRHLFVFIIRHEVHHALDTHVLQLLLAVRGINVSLQITQKFTKYSLSAMI
jgi:hypothetical protein